MEMPETPQYREIVGPDAERALPTRRPWRTAAQVAAWHIGRSRILPHRLEQAQRRLERDPRAPSLRFEYAEGWFGGNLVTEVDPARLGSMLVDTVLDGTRALRLAHWFLDAGDWAGATRLLAGKEVDEEVAALFGPVPYRDSPAYARLLGRMKGGDSEIRNGVVLSSPALIDAYFEFYAGLRDSIVQHGFRRREHLPPDAVRPFLSSPVRGRRAEAREREVGVAVCADGALLRMLGGRHRTAVAQHLRLRRIPVQVRLVHVRWLRDWMTRTGLPADQALACGIRALADG